MRANDVYENLLKSMRTLAILAQDRNHFGSSPLDWGSIALLGWVVIVVRGREPGAIDCRCLARAIDSTTLQRRRSAAQPPTSACRQQFASATIFAVFGVIESARWVAVCDR